MKKTFEFTEIVKYHHAVEIEVDNEDEFEEFTEQFVEALSSGDCDDRAEVFNAFCEEFGENKVECIEDGSPEVEIELW